MTFSFESIVAARSRIAPYITTTPLIRLKALDSYLGCEVYGKAECMQITGSFKLRGAMNRALTLTKDQLLKGLVTASSGNHGRGVSYAGKILGAKATIVIPRTAPQIKIDGIKALGAQVVLCDLAERFEIANRISAEQGAVMIPPFNDAYVMSGQGTIGMELVEQCPGLNKVVVPVAGGGLIGGISTAIKQLSPSTEVYGAEPAARARYCASVAAGKPTAVAAGATVADALAATIPGEICFPFASKNTDKFVPVEDKYLLKGMKLLLTEGKILAEPSSCIGIGAVLQGLIEVKPTDKVCFVLSGGNVSLEQLDMLKEVTLD